ncbi:MAG: hypothetical protein NW205_12385 [Hyphomicrobiaceae bacterium]|nr:hypothetical protein [Hyphomicrobiaceae bacterium]
MIRSILAVVAMSAALAAASNSASAAAVTLPATSAPALAIDAAGSLLTPVHGWHTYCAWGPAGYHRHVPGVGRVACHRRGGYRRYGRCSAWRAECASRWGYGWRYRRCLRIHGC